MSKSNIPFVIRKLEASVNQLKKTGFHPEGEEVQFILRRIIRLKKEMEKQNEQTR